jgi:hypothetical protein
MPARRRLTAESVVWPWDFAAVRSYLATANKHGRRPFDALTERTSGNVWIPVTT